METMIAQNPNYWGPILSTHPLGYRELIVRSLRLYFASFPRVIWLSFLLSILLFLPRLISYVLNVDIVTRTAVSLNLVSLNLIWFVVLNLAVLVVLAAMFWHIHSTAHYKPIEYNQDFMVGVRKVLYIFCAEVIQNIIIFAVFGGIYLFVLVLFQHKFTFIDTSILSWPLILTMLVFSLQFGLILYVSTLFVFLVPIIATENEHILASIKRTVSLTWKHWWRVFSTQVTPWVSFAILSLCIKFFLGINLHIYFLMQEDFRLGPILLQIFLFALFIIWPASLLYVQLKDLELRKKAELNA